MPKIKSNAGCFVRNPNFVKPESDEDENDSDSGVSTDVPIEKKKPVEKRKNKVKDGNKAKKMKSDKLTLDEINEIRETEDLYHSNLFRMQIDETLKEVSLKNKEKEFITKWIATLRKFLNKLHSEDLTHLLKSKDYPLKFKPMEDEKKLQIDYHPPKSLDVYGSFSIDTNIGNKSIVDVLLVMPNSSLKHHDYLNQTFIHKKCLYLLHIAMKLREKETLGGNIRIENFKNDPLKPVLMIDAEDFNIAINAVPPEDFFKLNRFIPKTNNIKLKKGEESVVPTPHYNFEILFDCVIEKNQKMIANEIGSHENVKNAIKLLKIWTHQRQFDSGFHPFNGFIITCYLLHLLRVKKIYPTMSCYQIIRLFWNQFGQSKFDEFGISLCSDKNLPNQPEIQDFFNFYDMVLIDSSGYCNILSMLSVDLYRRVRSESLNAIKMLDNKSINSFHQLFMTTIPFYIQFDQIVVIKYDEKSYHNIIERKASSDEKIDFHNFSFPLIRKLVMSVMRRGLGDRVNFLVPLSDERSNELSIGMILNPENALNIVEKGPQANEPEAEGFRKFWGAKAEIRRFKDGSITESVLWCSANAPFGEKRLISHKIVAFLLSHHFNIISNKINFIGDQFDVVIKNIFNEMIETIEERSLIAIRSFDEVSKELRSLNDLPLEIVSVLGTDAIFRYADVTPPRANAYIGNKKQKLKTNFRAQKVLNGIIQLSPSGKWPDDTDAMRRIKAAFYIEIEKRMSSEFPKTKVHISSDFIDILKNKLVYRLKIVHPKEIALAKEEISKTNNLTKLYRTNEESLRLEVEGTILPKLTSSLHGLHHQCPSFGPTAAMAKRWLYSQMIDSFLWPDEVTELIVAYMMLKNIPMSNSLQPQTGFFRFLHQIANFNHETDMIVVNFNDELQDEQLEEIERKFQKNRNHFPSLFIVTSCDFQNYAIWTSKAPSVNILHRVKLLAQHSIKLIEESFMKLNTGVVKDIFTPSLVGYDLLIDLNQEFVKRHDVVLHNFTNFKAIKYEEKGAPPAGVNFVEKFLNEVREAYDDFAVFFYNPIGGSKIAMLWKPSVHETREFSASQVNGCKLVNGRLRVNVEAIIKDIEIIGQGLITTVEILNEI
ncbi:CLUMA_CG003156, isoform A [Clunio marinus]|uniref:Nucleolar protein 6 n=1 Tax=Clunio marinus TaxID=568069 RepID=A0A1J1HSE7_9DIPT|nr:CLUMA_CG003156, isoform A [Clunio marinus]